MGILSVHLIGQIWCRWGGVGLPWRLNWSGAYVMHILQAFKANNDNWNTVVGQVQNRVMRNLCMIAQYFHKFYNARPPCWLGAETSRTMNDVVFTHACHVYDNKPTAFGDPPPTSCFDKHHAVHCSFLSCPKLPRLGGLGLLRPLAKIQLSQHNPSLKQTNHAAGIKQWVLSWITRVRQAHGSTQNVAD